MQVADYFASFGLRIDKSSVAKADATLDRLEARLNGIGKGGGFRLGRFSINQAKMDAALDKALAAASLKSVFNITKFDVNQTALNIALGTALDIASARNVFHISRFNVDQSHLNSQMINAMANAARIASATTSLRPRIANSAMPNERAVSRRSAAATGGIAGGLSRVYAPALGLALGGYGLSSLNQKNQEVVAAQLQSQAVSQAFGGTAEQGTENFQFLRNLGNKVGFNYVKASPDFNNLMSNLLGAGGTQEQARNIFKGFAEYGRVNKLSAARQNLVFNALSQVAGKNALQAEELTKQLGNSLPGAKSLFAEAYQRKIGGSLTGQESIAALEAAMKKGQVKGDILNYAAQIASERAQPGLTKASQASQAEQAKYQNTVSDLAVVASDAGVEEGFARIFRTLNAGLSESNDLVKTLAEGFNDATKWADDLLLWPQSFIRALEGKDSLVADWLGVDRTQELIKDWNNIKNIWDQLTSGPTPEWLPTLEATSKELAAVLKQGAEFAQWLKTLRDAPNQQVPDASFSSQPITASYQLAGRIVNGVSSGLDAAKARGQAVWDDPTSPYYQQPDRYDADMAAGVNRYENLSGMQFDGIDSELQFKKDQAQAAFEENYATSPLKVARPSYIDQTFGVYPDYSSTPSGQPFQDLSSYNSATPAEVADMSKAAAMNAAEQTTNNNQSNQFDIQITIDGATLMGLDVQGQGQALADAFTAQVTAAFEHAQTNYPTRE